MVMWERLDAPARRVMLAALDAADELGHGYIGDEHILLGLLGEDAGPARRFLERHGLSIAAARTELLLPDSRRERSPTAPRPSRRPARGRDRCRPCRTPAHRRLRTRRPQQGSLPSQLPPMVAWRRPPPHPVVREAVGRETSPRPGGELRRQPETNRDHSRASVVRSAPRCSRPGRHRPEPTRPQAPQPDGMDTGRSQSRRRHPGGTWTRSQPITRRAEPRH